MALARRSKWSASQGVKWCARAATLHSRPRGSIRRISLQSPCDNRRRLCHTPRTRGSGEPHFKPSQSAPDGDKGQEYVQPMRMFPQEFPSGRRRKPRRQAERRVYEALAGNDRQGFCYYEWRKGYERIELDFAVWVKDLGRFALQVKGGKYRLVDGDWYLVKWNGSSVHRHLPVGRDQAGRAGPARRHRGMCVHPLQPVRHSRAGVPRHGGRSGYREAGPPPGRVCHLGAWATCCANWRASSGAAACPTVCPWTASPARSTGVTDGLIRLDEIEEETSEDQCTEARATPTPDPVGGRPERAAHPGAKDPGSSAC